MFRPVFVVGLLAGSAVLLNAASTATSANSPGNWTAASGVWSNGAPTTVTGQTVSTDVTIAGKNITFPSTSGTTFAATVHDLTLLGTAGGAARLSDSGLSGNRTLGINGTFTLAGYSVTNTATATVKTININSGANLTVNNFGVISGVSGTAVNILAGATADLNDGSTVSRAFNNFGTTTQTGTLSAGNTLTNKNGGVFNVAGTGEIQTGSFVNQNGATLAKVGGGQSDMKLSVNNQAGGSITVDHGILQMNSTIDNSSTIRVTNASAENEFHSLSGTFTNKATGSLTIETGAAWNNDSVFIAQDGSVIHNDGIIQFASSTATFEGGTGIAGGGETSFQTNSTALFEGTNYIDNAVTFLGTVAGTGGTLDVNGAAVWNGSLNAGTDTQIKFNGSLAITGDYDASGSSNALTVANGTTTLEANKNIVTAAGGSDFANSSTGTFTMANNGSGITGDGAFVNRGSFTKSSSGTDFLDTAAFSNDGGTVAIASGSLAAVNGATYVQEQTGITTATTNLVAGASLGATGSQLASATFNAGSLTGNGTLAATMTTFNDTSTISPGNSIGTLHFDGDLTFNSGSTYALQLFSTPGTAGVANDLLDISGSLQLPSSGFNLSVSSIGGGGLINSFVDSGNYSWTIASAIGGIVGFNGANISLDLAGIGNTYTGNWSWGLGDMDHNLLLNYSSSFTPVPEPSTYAAIGVMLCGGLVFWRRRQRARQSAISSSPV